MFIKKSPQIVRLRPPMCQIHFPAGKQSESMNFLDTFATTVSTTWIGVDGELHHSKAHPWLLNTKFCSVCHHLAIIFRRNAWKALCSIGIGFAMFVRSTQNQHLEYLKNRSQNHQILHGHPHWHCLQPYQIWRHYLFPFGSYSEKTVENTTSDSFGWNFSRTV